MTKEKESNNNILVVVGILFFAVIAVLFLIVFAIAMLFPIGSNAPESTLTVEATASERVSPDTAIATFVYSQQGESVDQLNDEADEVLEVITQYLLDQGVDTNDIVTNKNTYPDYQYRPDGSADETNMVVEVNFEVTFRDIQNDLSKPNTVLDELTNLGVNRFYGFRYTVDNSEAICERLETEAIEKAYELATERVQALDGGRITARDVQPIGGNCGDEFGYPFPLFAEDAAVSSDGAEGSTRAPELSAGQQELTANATVKVTYR